MKIKPLCSISSKALFVLRLLQRLCDCGNQAGNERLIQDCHCFQYAENAVIIDSSVVLDKLPEGDTEAFNAGSKLRAENMPRTIEESDQNKQSGYTAIFILLHWNTLTGILSLNKVMLLKPNAKNSTHLFSSNLADSTAVSPRLPCSRALHFVMCGNAKLNYIFLIQ